MISLPQTGFESDASDRTVRNGDAPLQGPVRVLALTKSTGGIALYHQALVAGLNPARFSIHTLCLSDQAKAYAAELQRLGTTTQIVAMERYRINPFGDVRVMRIAMAAARRTGAQVILCHGSKPGLIGRVVGWWLGIPTVYCQASLPFLARIQGRRSRLYRIIERVAGAMGGTIVCLSDGARALTLAHGIARADRLCVLKSGIDTARFSPKGRRLAERDRLGLAQDRPVLGWIGRFEPQKAPEVFIDAVAKLAALRPDVQVVMAGEGRLKDEMTARIAAHGLSARIRLLPWQSDPASLMEAIDVFALSSRWEGLPLILLETMAMGCVPVSTDVDGCAEVVEHGKNGFLVPADDPDALAASIALALETPDRLRALSAAARQRVAQDFDVARMLAEWDALLVAQARRSGAA